MNIAINVFQDNAFGSDNMVSILEDLNKIQDEFKIVIVPKEKKIRVEEETSTKATCTIIGSFVEKLDCEVVISKSADNSKGDNNAEKTSRAKKISGKEFFEDILEGKVDFNTTFEELVSRVDSDKIGIASDEMTSKMNGYLKFALECESEDVISKNDMAVHFEEFGDMNFITKIRNLISNIFEKDIAKSDFKRAPSFYEFLKAYRCIVKNS